MRIFCICWINFVCLMILSLLFMLFGLIFLMKELIYFIEWELITINSCLIVMTFLFDWMSLIFMSFVLFISSLVIFYSKEYMNSDMFINRFILLVILFVFSMMLMIISPNLISILLGWDGLGLVSYCLVIYFQNLKSYNAGMLTVLSNRIGDVALLIAIAWMLNYGSWSFIFYIDMMKNDLFMEIISFLVILAAMTKSAQIPFSSWLPAAMAAPTPVSALVHSSTLVTAGVYLLIRFNVLFIETVWAEWLMLIGGLTMFMAGVGANFEFDLKKIIALSTLSQLGLMMMVLAMGFPGLAFFHLLTHAMFKALLFLCAGGIIHSMKNSQDIRDMGSLFMFLPFTTSCLNVANMALCGMPFLAGFYSKDLILEVSLLSYLNVISLFLYFFSTGLTVCYTLRLTYYSLLMNFNVSSLNPINDEGSFMSKGMIGLLFMAVVSGAGLSWLYFSTFMVVCLPIYFKNLTLTVCLMGGLGGYFLSVTNFNTLNKSLDLFYKYTFFFSFMWFMPQFSTMGVSFYPLKLGFEIVKILDQGWSEFFGGQKIYYFMSKYSSINQFIQNNNLKIYLMIVVFWVILLMMILIFI